MINLSNGHSQNNGNQDETENENGNNQNIKKMLVLNGKN